MVDRYIPIRLYPSKDDSSGKDEEKDEVTFTTVVDKNVSERNKTNLREVKFTKIDLMAGNAEEYCSLRKRLQDDKWGREDPDVQTFWKRARDFGDCVSARSRFTYDAALAQLMTRVHAIYAEKYPSVRRYMKTKVKPDDLKKMEFWKLEELYKIREGNDKDAEFWDRFVAIELSTLEEDEEPLDEEHPFLYWLEREFWEDMARIVFREPHNAYRTQMKYLTGDIQKPYKETFMNYKARVEQVFGYLKYFPAPCLRGTRPEHVDFLKRDENISSEVVRLAIFESLPWKWRDMYDSRESADCRGLSEAEFMATILRVEDMDNAERAAAKKKPAASNPNTANASRKRSSGDGGNSNTGERSKNKRSRHFCQKCKDLGRSEKAYTSHNQANCKATAEARSSNNSDNAPFHPTKKEWKKMLHTMEKVDKLTLKDRADSDSE